ncbi:MULTISPECIES: hypothetical protein [unclassified Lysinibacillus]|uniref:hypothetical protein n=1 Tax=unclassified Lysinibacillus TaxID=2636778 RepID=UPI0037FE33F3
MVTTNKWISNDVFNLEYETDSSIVLNIADLKRAYEVWEHARSLIEKSESAFHLSDGITNLKRALNQRLQLIEKIYNFKNINLKGKHKGYLELLEFLGIVRPFLMKQLLTIRNDIEHRDAEPPSFEKCLELLDAVWYFLKSTDYLVRYSTNTILFEEDNIIPEDASWVELTYRFDIHKFNIRGRLSYDYVSDLPTENSFEMECTVYDTDKTDMEVRGGEDFNYFDGELNIVDVEKTFLIKKFLLNF